VKAGRRLDIAASLKGWMEHTGFENITEEIYEVPLGPWDREDLELK
jgi:hypothetical protein